MRRLISGFVVLFAALCLTVAAQAQVICVSNNVPPPELPVYDQPPIPAPGYIWTPGYWGGSASGYFWVPGIGAGTTASTHGRPDIGGHTSVSTAASIMASVTPAADTKAATGITVCLLTTVPSIISVM
jgi:hypothetical protein